MFLQHFKKRSFPEQCEKAVFSFPSEMKINLTEIRSGQFESKQQSEQWNKTNNKLGLELLTRSTLDLGGFFFESSLKKEM